MSIRSVACILAVLACGIGTATRSQAQVPLSPQVFDRLLVDEVDGAVWARGRNYKASFSEHGASFIPFLGSTAPRNYPVTFAIASVTAGGSGQAVWRHRAATRRGNDVVIERGVMDEIYALGVDDAEQLFRFERPLDPGDVVVRMAVLTDLAMTREADGSVLFRNERGGMRYGAAIVLDAAGRRAPIETKAADGAIELVVPAAFLVEATFPVTIDPVVSFFGFPLAPIPGAITPAQFLNADTAYDAATGKYFVTYESVYSATDHDVYVLPYTPGQSPPPSGPVITIDFTSLNWAKPKIASNQGFANVLVVAERTLSGGAVVIGGRTVDTASLATSSSQFQISGSETGQKSHPDVGGDPNAFPFPAEYCVVWQNTPPGGGLKRVYYCMVSPGAFVYPSAPLGIVLGFFDDSFPSISKSSASSGFLQQNWMVVWQRTAGPGNQDIWGASIDWAGNVVSDGFPIDTSSATHTAPQVSTPADVGFGSRYLVVYEETTGGGPATLDTDIVGCVADGTATVAAPVNLTTLLGAPANDDQFNPCVDSDGVRFAIGYTQKGSPFATEQGAPYLATVHLAYGTTLGLTEVPVLVNGYAGPDENLQIASAYGGGGAAYGYFAVWHTTLVGSTWTGIGGAEWNGWSSIANFGPSVYFATILNGCGSLNLAMSGFPALGSPVTATLSGVEGTPYLIIGTSAPPIALCTGCLLGVDLATAMIIQTDTLTATIPTEGAFVNVQIAIQGADLGSTTGCTGAPSFSLSGEVLVTIL